jgi:hypothetical protein
MATSKTAATKTPPAKTAATKTPPAKVASRFTPAKPGSGLEHRPKAAEPAFEEKQTRTTAPRFAPVARMATLTSWSYSVYTAYMKCPLSVCFDKIKKIRIAEPPNPHFEKGDRVHKAAEQFIGGTGRAPAVIPELVGVKDKLSLFRKARAAVELEWAFTERYLPTSWFGKDAWLRVKTDVCMDTREPPLVHITDWKTGKIYDEHKQQRSLYALAGLQLVELGLLAGGSRDVRLTAEHLYTDTTQSATEEYTMEDLKLLKREWSSRIKTMMSDTRYPAKTGFHCRYCKFRKSAGGPCQENQ